MADDPNQAKRAEFLAVLKTIVPQIRGLHALQIVSSDDLAAVVTKQIAVRERRSDLLAAAIHAIDGLTRALAALHADGYPTPIPNAAVAADLLSELQGEETDLDAAVGLFRAALTINLDVANAHFTSQSAPTEKGP